MSAPTSRRSPRAGVEAALGRRGGRGRGLGRGVHQPPDPRLRRRGREPERRRRPRDRHPRVRRRPLGLRLRHRPRRARAAGAGRRPPTPRPRVADPDEHGGLPEETGHGGRRASWPRRRWRTGPPSARSSWRSRWSAPRAAAEGVSQVENAVYSDREGAAAIANSRGFSASYASTQAWAYASAFAGEGDDLMTGLGVGPGARPGRARPGGDRGRGGRPRARAGGRAPAAEPPLPGGAGRVRGGVVRRLHRGDAVGRRGPARPLAVRRAARARRWPSPRSRWSTTAPTRTAPPARRSTARARATRRTPLIEGGRLRRLPLRRAHRAQGRPRDHRQRRPRVLPLAAHRCGTPTCWSKPASGTLEELVRARPATACT